MKHLFYFLSLLAFTTIVSEANAQGLVWAKGLGGDSHDDISSIVHDAAGNTYVTGFFQDTLEVEHTSGSTTLVSAGEDDIFFAKYDPDGNCVWIKGMGGTGQDRGIGIQLDGNGDIVLTGFFVGTVDFDPGSGVTNLTSTSTFMSSNIFLAKYTNGGNLIWAKRLAGNVLGMASGITVDNSNNIIISGMFMDSIDLDPGAGAYDLVSPMFSMDGFIAKYTPGGEFEWGLPISGNGQNQVYGVEAKDNFIYVTGDFEQTVDFNPLGVVNNLTSAGAGDAFLAKYTSSGQAVWVKSIGGPDADRGTSLAVDAAQNVYLTGHFEGTAIFEPGTVPVTLTSNGDADIFLAKYDADGDQVWVHGFGADRADFGVALALDQSEAFLYLTGTFRDTVDFDPGTGTAVLVNRYAGEHVFIGKYDTDGGHVFAKGLQGHGGSNIISTAIAVDGADNIYLTGRFKDTIDFDPGPDTFTLTTVNAPSPYADGFIVKLSCTNFVDHFITACDSFTFEGHTYTASGTYVDTFINSSLCDSIVTLHLMLNHSVRDTITAVHCDSVTYNGETYMSSGVYSQVFPDVNGCDSTLVYALTIHSAVTTSLLEAACDSFSLNGELYTNSGVYTQTYLSVVTGCDSTVELDLTIHNTPEATVTKTGTTLTASSGGEGYQWLDCNDGSAPIPGATEQTFNPTSNGHYAVRVTKDGCANTSECVEVDGLVGISGLEHGFASIELYPNPTSGQLTIQAATPFNQVRITMVNLLGQVVQEYGDQSGSIIRLNIDALKSGMYLVEIAKGEHLVRYKVIKE